METSRDSTLSLTSDVGVLVVINSNPIQISGAEERAAVSLMMAATLGVIAPFVTALGARVGWEGTLLMAGVRVSHLPKWGSLSRPRVRLLLGITDYGEISLEVSTPRLSPSPPYDAWSRKYPHCKRRGGETLIRRMLRRDQ